MPNDAQPGDDTVKLIRAMAIPLASAHNYLAGVQVRAHSLTDLTGASEEVSEQILVGITCAIRHLQVAASLIEHNRREVMCGDSCAEASEKFALAQPETTDDLMNFLLAALARE
ncbi:hypothetical protein [Cryobacterium sp. PH29-G1]|uniref:hypothetical protein n=1 Tax=Cryobacterium sp. PH29-G1 TaxID=3046211 RepID=UPI0024BA9928|nr:hypothetical protein [Cryobacterium sp. PH29-G1]MDJ0347926.1 hypothetical protein [Cryobacterium sp. PH29-G1]